MARLGGSGRHLSAFDRRRSQPAPAGSGDAAAAISPVESAVEAEPTRDGARLLRVFAGLGLLLFGATAVMLAVLWSTGRQPWDARLGERERNGLLARAGLPGSFPIHPGALRTQQPQQGGFSYNLREPVPDVLAWHQLTLGQAGYVTYNADVAGQDPYLPRWLYFRSDDAFGAIIIRERQGRPGLTEVKILSRSDPRLVPPTR